MPPSRRVLVHVETTELQQIDSPCRLLARPRGAEEDRREFERGKWFDTTFSINSSGLEQLPQADSHVRYGSQADIVQHQRHVRFTPNNGCWAAHPSQHWLSVYEYTP